MNQPPPIDARPALATDDAIAVVSAYGAFRLLLGLLGVWSFFAGFALLIGAMSFGDDAVAGRVIGAHMIVLAPVYGLLAWRRTEYRLFIWIPYAAQAAIVLPALWEILVNQNVEGALLMIISIIFLVLLVYLWWSSHPLGFFQPAPEELEDEGDAFDDDLEDDARPPSGDASSRARRYRRSD